VEIIISFFFIFIFRKKDKISKIKYLKNLLHFLIKNIFLLPIG